LPSATGRVLEPRERRTITAAATVVAVAAFTVLVAMPVSARWTAREQVIGALRDRASRLAGLLGHEVPLRARADSLERALEAGGPRLVQARTPALAASAVQSLLQDAARASQVAVSRLDVAGEPVTAGASGIAVPAVLSATGDIYGVADYLRRLQHGPQFLEIRELTISPNPTLRGNLLQFTLTVRVPIALEP
jgi:type II secretory pathway component PulM